MIADTPPGAADLLRGVPALAGVAREHLDALVSRSELRVARAGAPLVAPDGRWTGAGLILAGEARVLDERGRPVEIAVLGVGGVFAHESLLSNAPYPYHVYASSDCTVLLVARATFDAWLASRPALLGEVREAARRHERRGLLERSMLAGVLDAAGIEAAAAAARDRRIAPGELLVTEGRAPDAVFVVGEGRLRLTRGGGDAVGFAQAGDLIEETGIVAALARDASVVAETECRVLAIPADAFRALVEGERAGPTLAGLLPARSDTQAPPRGDEPADEADALLHWKLPEYQPPPRRFAWLPRRRAAVRQQSAMDCGPACLATICRHYGKRVSLNRLREMCRVGSAGASMLNILHAARAIGFEAHPILSTLEHLRGNHLPALVNWRGYHWIVVHAVDDRRVVVADPGAGVVTMTPDEFSKGWTRYTIFMRPTPAFAAVEESRPTLAQFTPYVAAHRREIVEIGVASLTIQVLALLLPLFSKVVVDDVIVPQRGVWLAPAVAGITAAIVLQWAVSWARQRLLLFVSYRVNLRLMADFYAYVLRLPLPFFERRRVGDVVSRLEENARITSFFTTTAVEVLIDTVTAILYFGLMLSYNVWLTGVAALCFVLHFVNVYMLTPRLQQGFREAFARGAELESHTIESLAGLRTIRTLGVEQSVRAAWENLFARATNAYFATLKYGIASASASQVVNAFGSIAVLFVGARFVLDGQLTIGGLVAFTVLAGGALAPVSKLVSAWDLLQETLNAIERLNDVYESEPEAPERPGDDLIVLPALSGHVRFEDVTFRYDPEGKNALQNLDLEILSGQRVAFVGRSGSGKSTLIKLLLGLYRPTTGRILVDGFDLADVWLPSLRRQFAVVPQSPFLFHGTVRDNIAQAQPDAPPAEVERAAVTAYAHDFITRMPDGYQTTVEEEGKNLSGGQRQRIAIARAILQQPRIVLLDEATSALDTESEQRVTQNLDTVFAGRTMLTIAHRLSTIRHADLIVVLDRGAVVEKGSHDELMAKRGLYYYISTQQLNL
jgi:ATP-binding cassette subfamily B protein